MVLPLLLLLSIGVVMEAGVVGDDISITLPTDEVDGDATDDTHDDGVDDDEITSSAQRTDGVDAGDDDVDDAWEPGDGVIGIGDAIGDVDNDNIPLPLPCIPLLLLPGAATFVCVLVGVKDDCGDTSVIDKPPFNDGDDNPSLTLLFVIAALLLLPLLYDDEVVICGNDTGIDIDILDEGNNDGDDGHDDIGDDADADDDDIIWLLVNDNDDG
jgi:hypothetical protein